MEKWEAELICTKLKDRTASIDSVEEALEELYDAGLVDAHGNVLPPYRDGE